MIHICGRTSAPKTPNGSARNSFNFNNLSTFWYVTSVSTPNSHPWITDSGASDHMTCSCTFFSKYFTSSSSNKVKELLVLYLLLLELVLLLVLHLQLFHLFFISVCSLVICYSLEALPMILIAPSHSSKLFVFFKNWELGKCLVVVS